LTSEVKQGRKNYDWPNLFLGRKEEGIREREIGNSKMGKNIGGKGDPKEGKKGILRKEKGRGKR